MAGATLQGVTVLSRKKGTRRDAFELDLTPDGIAIRRPGQAPRHLAWDRVTEWEVEQRHDGVLLTLRGGGSVTPLVVPRWTVDDLDSVLREVTGAAPAPAAAAAPAPAPAPAPTPTPVTDPVLEEVVASAPAPQEELKPEPDPEPVRRAVPGETVPEGTLVWPDSAPLDSVGDLVWPGEEEDGREE